MSMFLNLCHYLGHGILDKAGTNGSSAFYRTATVTVLLGVPLMITRPATAPGVRPVGTATLICHSPM